VHVVAPAVEYVPTTVHGVHVVEAVVEEYVPAAQGVQVSPLAPLYPAGHVHDTRVALPTSEMVLAGHATHPITCVATCEFWYVFAGQDVQATDPVADLYFPGPQFVHVAPSAPVYPARHVHDMRVPLPATENVLPGHARQVVATVALSAVE
jgi:hypothetical protein